MGIFDQKDFLRTKETAAFLGISRSTLWKLEQTDPTFPRKITITSRCVGWRLKDLQDWLDSKQAA